jgi:drug/metabolite transporter (DMT)-like permease
MVGSRPAPSLRLVWAAFFLVAIIWGSSFLLIRIAVHELSPFQLVAIRTAIAAVGLNLVLAAQKRHLPLTRRSIGAMLFAGVIGTTLPFGLITWGEQSVESGLASVFNATTPLFTLLFAHFAFADERITPMKALGLLVGFIGVVVLSSRAWAEGALITGDLIGMLAIVAASVCYGISGINSRRLMKQFDPIMLSAGIMTVGACTSGVLMLVSPVFGGQPPADLAAVQADTLVSVLILGVLNTFVAYLIHFWVLRELGAAKASMVTYVSPVVAIVLGAVILNELIDWRLLAGAALVFSAIGLVNWRSRRAGSAHGVDATVSPAPALSSTRAQV